jgi:two-component system sensor histidine kinase QseC
MARQRLTLRGRLLAGTAAATAGILLLAGLLIYVIVRSSLRTEFDTALTASLRAIAALTEQDAHTVRMEPETANVAEFRRKERPDYFAAWLPDGTVVATSASLEGKSLPHADTPRIDPIVYESVRLPDGLAGRQATIRFVPPVEDPTGRVTRGTREVVLTVARHTWEVDQKLAGLAWLLAGVVSSATLAAAGAMWLVVGRGLRPLAALASRISAIDRQRLGGRVELSDAPAELTPVVQRLNELLDRVQSMVLRERRFTADVSHELRTPLAGLEAMLDVCATRPRTSEEYGRTLAKCLRIVRSMHVMVDNLLTLARADARQLTLTRSRVWLGAFLEECWVGMAADARAKSLAAVFQVGDDVELETDPDKLRIVINNLLDNAVRHSDEGGWVRVQAGRTADRGVELLVSNSGSTLSADDAQRTFDRFWRGETSRKDTGLHCGLGLSLCREMVALLGGRIAATSEPGGVFEVRVWLPQSVSQSPAQLDDSARQSIASVIPSRVTSPSQVATQCP